VKQILVCADDFSQNNSISEGILILAKQQRINAISCLVNLPIWSDHCKELPALARTCQLGLHLNLTFGPALSTNWQRRYGPDFRTVFTLLKQSYLGYLNQHCVEAEIHAQLDAFARKPDFIDGHQHVHQFPIIRQALLAVYRQRNLSAFCRNTSSYFPQPKQQLIAVLGGHRFKRLLKEKGILANSCFAGAYPFAKAKNYRQYFKQFLNQMQPGGLVVCHPGLSSEDFTDPLHCSREHEFNYLMSELYLSDLEQAKCQLSQGLG
jgi:predicted glycoside hydrolase/deacetylase ChbG (UPF0249 family)